LLKINKSVFVSLLLLGAFTEASFAERGNQNYGDGRQTHYENGVNVPVTTEPNKHLVRDRLEMDTGKNAESYKTTQYKRMERKRVLNEIFDPMVLMTPIVRTIRPIDTIGISPAYITQILFPEDMIITDIVASFDMKIFESNKNILRLRPDAQTFYAGNIVVSMSDGNKNYTMSIFVERYYSADCREDEEEKSYICRKKKIGLDNSSKYKFSYNNLSTMYQYINPSPIDDMMVIALYERMMGKTLFIKENGTSVSISYEGIEYLITRDDRFGSYEGGIMYRGIGYRVDTSSNRKGGEV